MKNAASEKTGLARALSKLGFCSRSQAWDLIKANRVKVNGAVIRDAEKRVDLRRDCIEVDGARVEAERKVYLMLNKPRGLVTTASDEKGRATVFDCLKNFAGPRVFPVGRLDRASEGLLLFTNDTAWATRITDPASHLDKTYHVQIDRIADEDLLQQLMDGVHDAGEILKPKRISILRCGEKNSWLEVVLDEGKNRQIRRMLAALKVVVLRLVRVSVGSLQLGTLQKGQLRELSREEMLQLTEQKS